MCSCSWATSSWAYCWRSRESEEVDANPDDKNKKDTEQLDLKGSGDDTDLVVNEFCSNASYNEEKNEPTLPDHLED